MPVVEVLKCIETLCRDDFWWESVPGVDDYASEVVRSGWTILWLWPLVVLAGPLPVTNQIILFSMTTIFCSNFVHVGSFIYQKLAEAFHENI